MEETLNNPTLPNKPEMCVNDIILPAGWAELWL
jgi:hypothetical protein